MESKGGRAEDYDVRPQERNLGLQLSNDALKTKILPAKIDESTELKETDFSVDDSVGDPDYRLAPEEVVKTKPRSRKRKIVKKNWKRNVRQKSRQSGEQYVDQKGKVHAAKSVQKVGCKPKCTHSCMIYFNENERQSIHNMFWELNDESKNHFYSKFVQRCTAKRHKKQQKQIKRQYSYKYHFQHNETIIQICQQFFLSTLNISERRIYYFFKKRLDPATGVACSPKQGKHIKRITPAIQLNEIRDHINSFPRVESHYCRQSTSREYLESTLNIRKMYELYKEKCDGPPVKEHIYRKVFNEEFNLFFYVPKKDLCDTCAEYKMKDVLTDSEKLKIEQHRMYKCAAKTERDLDRQNEDKSTAIISYDLQNVFCLPKAEVSNFFISENF